MQNIFTQKSGTQGNGNFFGGGSGGGQNTNPFSTSTMSKMKINF
jgi:hypothetical protein